MDKLIASDERIGRDTPLDITTSPAVSQEGEMIKIAARRAYERMGQQDKSIFGSCGILRVPFFWAPHVHWSACVSLQGSQVRSDLHGMQAYAGFRFLVLRVALRLALRPTKLGERTYTMV